MKWTHKIVDSEGYSWFAASSDGCFSVGELVNPQGSVIEQPHSWQSVQSVEQFYSNLNGEYTLFKLEIFRGNH